MLFAVFGSHLIRNQCNKSQFFVAQQLTPTIAVYYQTSLKTRPRLRVIFHIWDYFYRVRSNFQLFEVYGGSVPKLTPIYGEVIEFQNCGIKREDLTCRYHQSMVDFVKNPDKQHLQWMMYADDDTFIRADLLMRYIQELDEFIDPTKHIVLKAHANREKRNILFVHGGPGWLMSRALCEYMISSGENLDKYYIWSRFYQPDTTMGIIARRMFKEPEWDERGFVGHLDVGSLQNASQPCLANQTFPFNQMLSVHAKGVKYDLYNTFRMSINASDDLQLYRVPGGQSTRICTGPTMPRVPLRDRTPVRNRTFYSKPLYKRGDIIEETALDYIVTLPDAYNDDGFDHSLDIPLNKTLHT